jgi:hypothetical protein
MLTARADEIVPSSTYTLQGDRATPAAHHRDRDPEETSRWTVEDATVNGEAEAGLGPCKDTTGTRYKALLVL